LVISTLQRCNYTFVDLEATFASLFPHHQHDGKLTWVSFISDDVSEPAFSPVAASTTTPTQGSLPADGNGQVAAPPRVPGPELLADARGLDKRLLNSRALNLVGLNAEAKDKWSWELVKVLFYSEGLTSTDPEQEMRFFSVCFLAPAITQICP
jgi:hypothetical protein